MAPDSLLPGMRLVKENSHHKVHTLRPQKSASEIRRDGKEPPLLETKHSKSNPVLRRTGEGTGGGVEEAISNLLPWTNSSIAL